MSYIKVTVDIPDTELAREALANQVKKITKAYLATQPVAKAVTEVKEPVEPESTELDDGSFEAVITKQPYKNPIPDDVHPPGVDPEG